MLRAKLRGQQGEGALTITGVGTVVWLDVLILQIIATFVFDLLLLWATAEVARAPTTSRRLVGASVFGSAYFVVYVLAQQGIVPYYGVLRVVPAVVLASIIMLLITFGRLPARRLVTIAAYFYGIGFISAGAGTIASFLTGNPAAPNGFVGFLAAGGSILLLAELGWGVVQRRIWQQLYQMPVEVRFAGKQQRMMALVDTGNRLRDPLTGDPVVVMEDTGLEHILPDNLRPALRQMAAGDLSVVSRLLASEQWSARFRIIPFSSIGKDNGLLVGFRPDALHLFLDGQSVATGPCIVAICKGPLDPQGEYTALIHPDLVQAASATKQTTAPAAQLVPERSRTGDVSTNV